jgi:hypothetical protein
MPLIPIVLAAWLVGPAPTWAAPASPASGRELLGQFGIDTKPLADGRPLNAQETATLLRVLYRWGGHPAKGAESFEINTFSLLQAERVARRDAEKLDFARQSDRLRGEFFTFTGRVVSIEPVRCAPQLADRFDFTEYYRCRLMLPSNRPAVIYAREVPQAWRQGAKPGELGGALAVYLKLLPGDEGPLFAAQRIAWYPPTPLGELRMDVGLLDSLQDRKPLGRDEHEAFYQALAAVGRAPAGSLMRLADKQLQASGRAASSVVPLFNRPQAERGRLVVLRGTARRAIKIFIDDAEMVARLGVDHYYEIGLFTEDSQDNPLVVCVPELPPGMPPGEDFRYLEEIRVAGFFLKVWSYRSARMDQGKPLSQLAPLVMAQTPVWHAAPPPPRAPIPAVISAGLFLIGLFLAAWMVWQTKASYSRRKKT